MFNLKIFALAISISTGNVVKAVPGSYKRIHRTSKNGEVVVVIEANKDGRRYGLPVETFNSMKKHNVIDYAK